jgi:RimJ/RimL family protein N-acetyltransferase
LQAFDAEELSVLADNLKIWDNVRDYFPRPYTPEHAVEFIKSASGQNPLMVFAIIHEEKFAGVIGLVPQADVHRFSAEIGFWIGEPYWNKGIATKAVKSIVDYAFNKISFNRLFAGVFEYNTASMKVLERAGFVKEAVFEEGVYKNGKFVNEHCFGLIKKNYIV